MLFMLLTHFCSAQFYDRTWLVGSVQAVKLSFNLPDPDTASFHTDDAHRFMLRAAANISDTNSNLLFYTNGSEIIDTSTYAMDGGDSIIDKLMYADYSDGVPVAQTTLIIPRKDNTYYLFYFSQSDSQYAANMVFEPDRFYYAIVDMAANNGRGKVISKRNVLYKSQFGHGRLTACRHANGRDWWVVHQGYTNNEYFIYLVTPDSIYPPQIQTIGLSDFYDAQYGAQAGFTSDGSKYFAATVRSQISLMRFDRCNGTFYDPDTIMIRASPYTFNGQSVGMVTGMPGGCFSSSGRFLYLNNTYEIWQFDTWASDVNASALLIGQWDSVSTQDFFGLYQMYLMPNGKIIIGNVALNTAFHLIDNPEVRGTGCHFRLNGLPVNTLNAVALPNMINYRLGALAGSGCDTLTAVQEIAHSSTSIHIQPNPTRDHIVIALSSYTSQPTLTITDATGRTVYRSDHFYLEQEVDVSDWAPAVYIVTIHSPSGQLVSRFVKE